jgi:hypothetical protein
LNHERSDFGQGGDWRKSDGSTRVFEEGAEALEILVRGRALRKGRQASKQLKRVFSP